MVHQSIERQEACEGISNGAFLICGPCEEHHLTVANLAATPTSIQS